MISVSMEFASKQVLQPPLLWVGCVGVPRIRLLVGDDDGVAGGDKER